MLRRLRGLWRGVRDRRALEAEMAEEFGHHVALRTEDLMRQGVPGAAAARQARLEFGHVETHRASARAARGLAVLDRLGFSWVDAKLGMRMAVKYPWVSGVSVLGMAVAIAIGAGAYAVIGGMLDPRVPLPEGERIVSLQVNTENPGNPERRALHDYFVWREELRTVTDVSALLAERRNLIVPGQTPEVVQVARMTPAGFRVAGVPPRLGRALQDEDDAAGAEPVLVIGYEEWQTRFAGAADVVGSTVRLGDVVHTIVGVMPEAFRFPINHAFWVPLRVAPTAHGPVSGPRVHMFGRLAAGASLAQAQAEIETVGRRLARAYPDTHARLRPRVLPFTHPFNDVDDPFMAMLLNALRVFISLLLVLVAVNVAMLIYARTVSRAGEIVVRTALGASRRRIISQLFVEALVLSGAAALLGVGTAWFALEKLTQALERATGGDIPFWLKFELTPGAVLYIVALTLVAGVIIGVVPALRATGANVQAGLQQISSRGSRLELGRKWTAMIVAQVAVAVMILPFVLHVAGQSLTRGVGAPFYPAAHMLRATLAAERDAATEGARADLDEAGMRERFGERAREVIRRMEAEPGVAGVTYAGSFPGDGRWTRIELNTRAGGNVVSTAIAPNLFDVFGVPVLAGRGFNDDDMRDDARTVIVDRTFVDRFIRDDGAATGRLLRVITFGADGEQQVGEWHEIVGVVPTFTFQNDFDRASAYVYHAVAPGDLGEEAIIVVKTQSLASGGFGARLREHAAAVDATMGVQDVQTVAAADRGARRGLLYLGVGMASVALSVLLLSAAGIYALMSFTVARRRREIGIRAALGANPRRVLSGIFARAAAQIGTGVIIGGLLATLLGSALGIGILRHRGIVLLAAVATLMMVTGLLAALGPARRSLAIQPTEAFRED